MAYEIRVDWKTAEVTADSGQLSWRVELSETPDTVWRIEFDRIKDYQSHEGVDRDTDLWVNSPSGMTGWVSGGGVKAEQEDRLRRTLDDLVDLTNKAADKALMASEEQGREKAEQAEALERAAKSATARLRSDD
jgi:hypothetical protein